MNIYANGELFAYHTPYDYICRAVVWFAHHVTLRHATSFVMTIRQNWLMAMADNAARLDETMSLLLHLLHLILRLRLRQQLCLRHTTLLHVDG